MLITIAGSRGLTEDNKHKPCQEYSKSDSLTKKTFVRKIPTNSYKYISKGYASTTE